MTAGTLPDRSRMSAGRDYLRIATEEAFAPPELIATWRTMIETGSYDDPGFISLVGFYTAARTERSKFVFDRLQDLGEDRLADMDAAGVDRQIISLTAPGTQVLTPDHAVAMATLANDQLSEACRRHPDRFSGLTAIAPQVPAAAASEIERGHDKLGSTASSSTVTPTASTWTTPGSGRSSRPRRRWARLFTCTPARRPGT